MLSMSEVGSDSFAITALVARIVIRRSLWTLPTLISTDDIMIKKTKQMQNLSSYL